MSIETNINRAIEKANLVAVPVEQWTWTPAAERRASGWWGADLGLTRSEVEVLIDLIGRDIWDVADEIILATCPIECLTSKSEYIRQRKKKMLQSLVVDR